MFNPISTYRIQFHKDFTFKSFISIIPYLSELGVHTIYASPILEATPGSMHGYDVTNPARLNPEIGTEEELLLISEKLSALQISWIQDIVPNHMAFDPNNLWLMDVLEKGITSDYYSFFDINWVGDPSLPVMVPFLGSSLEDAIENGDLQLVEQEGKIKLKYFETAWPVNDQVKSIDFSVKEAVELQFYRLCHWQETDHKINYRRFFTVNGLICLNIQHPETFKAYHAYIKTLLEQGIIQGLRVDHIDGLYDPEAYLNQLRELAGTDTYIVVEKILEEGEEMPEGWPVQGTTGYEFLADLNNLFTDADAKDQFTEFYQNLSGDKKKVSRQILDKKALILKKHMQGELENLHQLFLTLNFPDKIKFEPYLVKKALAKFLIYCPVYRFYGNSFPLKATERKNITILLKWIAADKELVPVVNVLKDFLLRKPQFYLRCMQFTGPLMAKGVEDTLMYTYNRFTAHNEVGDSPNRFGLSSKEFHEKMLYRQKHWPFALKATSTHDTKRGEDVRSRLNVLSDLPDEWITAVTHWKLINASELEKFAINPNDEYFIYQTLIGTYPMPGEPADDYAVRLQSYLEKALREGKISSDWASPNSNYEGAIKQFSIGLLDKKNPFWTTFSALHKKVSDFGILNSLTQLLLKFTLPGVADVYQGTELWDLSLVDPDNRRPVDYELRLEGLFKIGERALEELWADRYSGNIKLWLQQLMLKTLRSKPAQFVSGQYIPLEVQGKYAADVFAFARKYEDTWNVIAVPLHLARLTGGQYEAILTIDWEDTRIILPKTVPASWKNLLTGKNGKQQESYIAAENLFKQFPMAFLEMKPATDRASGVLMHITSLPSRYGIGDLGPEAMDFVDFLAGSAQKYWQLLPLNPISIEQSYSPYSSVSSMAGNILLISPEILRKDGLLDKDQGYESIVPSNNKVDFESVQFLKEKLLEQAYENYKKDPGVLAEQFLQFREKEADWLDDFALYMALKGQHNNLPWFKWGKDFKSRDPKALKKFEQENIDLLEKISWQQFIFFTQWAGLKAFANERGIKIFGDLPFYLSHDSADVWANPQLFKLDTEGQMLGIAGVPPDYFNSDGQLWGMPVYNWAALKSDNYDWWIKRIAKNLKLYDLLRLDHFRAFEDYWEVPAKEETAINGSWKRGPGTALFEALKINFNSLPFVAEDLGEINEAVYKLRDEFELLGMKVLQFAFGSDISQSTHIPHQYASPNFVVYTGTHDNNTTYGWYENELNKSGKKRLMKYLGKINAVRIHEEMIKLAMGSTAKISIIPMQDIIGLDQASRMNTPSISDRNWTWQLKRGQLRHRHQKKLLRWTRIYGRL